VSIYPSARIVLPRESRCRTLRRGESPHRLGVLLTLILTPAIYSSKLEASRKSHLVFHSQFIVADVVPLEQSRSKEGRSMQVVRAYSQSRNSTDPNRRSFVKLWPHPQPHLLKLLHSTLILKLLTRVVSLDEDSNAEASELNSHSLTIHQYSLSLSLLPHSLHIRRTRLSFSFHFGHIVCSLSRSKLLLLHLHISCTLLSTVEVKATLFSSSPTTGSESAEISNLRSTRICSSAVSSDWENRKLKTMDWVR